MLTHQRYYNLLINYRLYVSLNSGKFRMPHFPTAGHYFEFYLFDFYTNNSYFIRTMIEKGFYHSWTGNRRISLRIS
jgi:hypothetical protein